ncbi:MAG: type II secretion system protein [Cyanobacteria bacterium SIG30]|nr:type II secretion system protein [Cyanobacteria bacterium SIG30]
MAGGGASRSLKAFTLAEVLITLAIIGVVAALTIPSVITNYQNQERVAALKKTFSAIANTTNLAINEHGPISGWEIGKDNNGKDSEDFANKYLIPYLRVAKNCGTRSDGECAYEYYSLSGSGPSTFPDTYTKFYLSDGALVFLRTNNKETSNGKQLQGQITIDVNGNKPPNKIGLDVFRFYYMIYGAGKYFGGKLIPSFGVSDTVETSINNETAGCNKLANGIRCSHVIMVNGWKIPTKDEYVKMVGGNEEYRALYPW